MMYPVGLVGSVVGLWLMVKAWEPLVMPKPTQGTPGNLFFLTMVILKMKNL